MSTPEKDYAVSTDHSVKARTLIIADDLTGACDAAVAFSRRGIGTEVVLDMERAKETRVAVCAVCTETRDISEEQACAILRHVAGQQHIGLYDQIFKKIDSTFRGNTFVEIQASVDAFPGHFAVIAPAYPALGRTSAGGVVHISDIAGQRFVPVRDLLHETGLHPRWIGSGQSSVEIRSEMLQALEEGARAVFCDALVEEDLHRVVQAAGALETGVLWIGSAGLAHALAEGIPAQNLQDDRSSRGMFLVFAGSDHPVTQAQIACLRDRHTVCEISGGDTPRAFGEDASIVLLRVERGRTTEDEIRAAVATFAAKSISCMMMTGGDTAMLVCRALGIRSLRLHREFETGLPQGIAVDGDFAGCNIILKSGGFGEMGVLSRIADCFAQRKEAVQ